MEINEFFRNFMWRVGGFVWKSYKVGERVSHLPEAPFYLSSKGEFSFPHELARIKVFGRNKPFVAYVSGTIGELESKRIVFSEELKDVNLGDHVRGAVFSKGELQKNFFSYETIKDNEILAKEIPFKIFQNDFRGQGSF